MRQGVACFQGALLCGALLLLCYCLFRLQVDDTLSFKVTYRTKSNILGNLHEKRSLPNSIDPELEAKVIRLAQTALRELAEESSRNVSCIPAVCHGDYHFFPRKERLKNFTMLNTFPGSGNTWLRSVIREGTRVYTGSVYRDKSIAEEGYIGELRRAFRKYSTTSVIKAHYQADRLGMSWSKKMTSVVIIVRSPFDACVSEFNREEAEGHTALAQRNASKGYLFGAIGTWAKFHRSFNKLDRLYPPEPRPLREIEGFLKIEYRKFSSSHPAIPVLTMFYEDFVRDPTQATAYLYAFLKFQYGSLVPSVKDSVLCAAANAKREEKFHRKHTAPIGTPMYSWKRNVTTAFGDAMCGKVEGLWNAHKWGSCEGKLLKNTNILKAREPFVPGVENFPKCSDTESTSTQPTPDNI